VKLSSLCQFHIAQHGRANHPQRGNNIVSVFQRIF